MAAEPEDLAPAAPRDLGWWVIQGQAILDALHRVHSGDHPDIVMAELFANAIDERVNDEDD